MPWMSAAPQRAPLDPFSPSTCVWERELATLSPERVRVVLSRIAVAALGARGPGGSVSPQASTERARRMTYALTLETSVGPAGHSTARASRAPADSEQDRPCEPTPTTTTEPCARKLSERGGSAQRAKLRS